MNRKKLIVTALLTTLLFTGCGTAAGGNAAAGAAGGAGQEGSAAPAGDTAAVAGDTEKVLKLAESTDITTMDVHKTTRDYLLPMNVFDTLFSIQRNDDGSTEIVNSLVEEFAMADDGVTYHFILKDGIVFSDGTPLKAQDVKFTFERMLKLPESEQADYAMPIDGAQDLLDGKTDSLKGITVEDDRNFTIVLSNPFAGFTASLATPSASIFSEELVTAAGDDFGVVPEKTIGTGPYIIKEWNRGSGMVFEYNPKYWGEEPDVKRIEVTVMDSQAMNMAFQKGDIDLLDCMMQDSAIVNATYKTGAYDDRLVAIERMGLNFLMLNEKTEPLNDPLVRKAIQRAIDREAILKSIYSGDGKLEDGIYPTGCIVYNKENQGWLKYDPEEAKKLLGEAGHSDGFDLELCVDSDALDSIKNTMQVIAQNLNDVGIRTTIKTIEHAAFLEQRNSGDIPAYMALWIMDFNDPDNIIYPFFGNSDNTRLRSNNYLNDKVIERVAAAKTIVYEDERNKEYADLEKQIVQEDAAWVPMFSLNHLFVTSERVEKFTPHWAGWSDFYFAQTSLK